MQIWKTYLGTASTEDEAGTLGTWQFVAAASFKADDGTALKVLGICRALSVVIEFTVATDEGTVNRMLFPIRTWVVAELAAVTWWLSALWELEVCVIFEGCNKAEPAVDDELVWTSAVGVVLLRCKPLYTPAKEKQNSKLVFQKTLNSRQTYLHCKKSRQSNSVEQLHTWGLKNAIHPNSKHHIILHFESHQLFWCNQSWSSKLSTNRIQCLGNKTLKRTMVANICDWGFQKSVLSPF